MSAEHSTWRWKSSLAGWNYSLHCRSDEPMAQCLNRGIIAVLEYAAPFGKVTTVEVSTRERGDRAYVFTGAEIDLEMLHETILSAEDIQHVILRLDLAVTLGATGPETWLEHAARVFFHLDEEAETTHLIEIWVMLDVDIYSPITWGEHRENSELARRNGPRLAQFLGMIRNVVGAELDSIDCTDYGDHVDENGFH